jgi:ribosome-associated translation inhibitor RaiA
MADSADRPVRGKLLVYVDAHHFQLTDAEEDKLLDGLDALALAVENFPHHDLRVYLEWRPRNNEYVAKLSLLLPGRTLVCSEHHELLHAAYEKCVDALIEQAKAYKDQLGQVPERQKQEKGTCQELTPTVPIDPAALEAAAEAADYPAFRSAIAPYEDPLRLRVGRWIERYPEIEARIGRGLEVMDFVEGVFLAACEQYQSRPPGVRPGDWLEGLIDPCVRAILHHPDEELENINMARSACAAGPAVPPTGGL